MKKILILANSPGGLYRFRKELIQTLIEEGNEVYLSVPYTEILEPLKEIGAKILDIQIDRRGMNPLKDSKLLIQYFKIVRRIKPDLIMTYTIKPNIYGGLISRFMKIPYIVNITGLGTTFQGDGLFKKVIICLYKSALKKVKYIFFENEGNKQIFINNSIIPIEKSVVLNGAGVNLQEYTFQEYPKEEPIRFLFIGRVMREKGIDELLWVAEQIKKEYDNVEFDIIGGLEEDYKNRLELLSKKKIINYYGYKQDIKPFITKCHCIVLPSHHEGMSNVLLEGAAMGRPLITSNIHGCKEAVNNSEYLCNVGNKESLYEKIVLFINLPMSKKENLAKESRRHVEKAFSREKVIKDTLNKL
ncbi:MAG: glycosyltransferase family 4 protein [Zhenhengia sp.]